MQNLCSTFDPSPEGVVSCKFGIIGGLNPPRGHGGGLLSLHESGVTVTGGHIKRPTAFWTHTYKHNLIPNLPQGHVFGLCEEAGGPGENPHSSTRFQKDNNKRR